MARLTGEITMTEDKQTALAEAASRLGLSDQVSNSILSQLWDLAFEQGRLAALDELQDRFCVCMK
jgi:hypothetical protein